MPSVSHAELQDESTLYNVCMDTSKTIIKRKGGDAYVCQLSEECVLGVCENVTVINRR